MKNVWIPLSVTFKKSQISKEIQDRKRMHSSTFLCHKNEIRNTGN